jgi:ABC-type amino acid transport substrate-binding protein
MVRLAPHWLRAAFVGLVLLAAVPALAQPTTLRIATGRVAPFVLPQDGPLAGFSVDLWTVLAQRLGAEVVVTDLGRNTGDAQLQAVRNGEADMAISAIAMTPEREELVDFSTSYFDSGLRIMVRSGSGSAWRATLAAVLTRANGEILLVAALTVLLLANALWLVERRNNPYFRHGYIPGVLEGLWGVMLIIATGEHGERENNGAVKRLTVVAMWVIGVVLVAQFTATVTASLTVQELQSSIQGPGDLPGKTIGTAPGSVAADYLTALHLPYVPITDPQEAYNRLLDGTIQAVVYDAPTLQYWTTRLGGGELQVVGPLFRPVKYGIAVARGNPLRKRINEALLELYSDGTYEDIYRKWFGPAK